MFTRAFPLVASLAALLSAVVTAPTAVAQTYAWSVLAGQPPQFGAQDGPAANARFKRPSGVVGDAQGNLYVADTYNHTIRKIAPDGSATTLAGKALETGTADGAGAAARFNYPFGLALDRSGNLYVADRSNHAIRKITPAGVVTTFAGRSGSSGVADGRTTDARFILPHGLAFDSDGNLIIADQGSHTIRRITPAGAVETVAGTAGPSGYADGVGSAARFFFPNDVVVDRAGNIFVADTGNSVIRRIDRDRVVTTLAGTRGSPGFRDGTGAVARFNSPMALALDANDNLYVADHFNDCIRRITPEGVVTVFTGIADARGSANGPASSARFFEPADLYIAADGSMFVADAGNHTIRKISAAETVTDHSGPGGGFGYVDGTGANARFNYPQGIALNGDRLYVAEGRNNRIRQVTTAGVVTSFMAGTHSGIAFGGDTLAVSNAGTHAVRIYSLSAGTFLELARTSTGANLFNQPNGLAIDRRGRIYLADTGNHVIRVIIITPGQIDINTVAGSAGVSGSADGKGTAARFNSPQGVAVDSADNVYVTDTGSHTIRRISPDGTVTTIAGRVGEATPALDGTGTATRFGSPAGIAVDGSGNVFVTELRNHLVRRITPNGVVSTLGGSGSLAIHAEGTGTQAAFSEPNGITVGPDGVIYVVSSSNNVIMKGVPQQAPVIAAQPQGVTIPPGGTAALAVTASGPELRYQWYFNGVPIAGANGRTYTVANATAAQAGRYTVEVSNATGRVISSASEVTVESPPAPPRIVNLSIRTPAGTGSNTLIVGLGIGGGGAPGGKSILLRGVGPSLAAFGVNGALADPVLTLFRDTAVIDQNDDWNGTFNVASVGAFALSGAAPRDAALHIPTLASGAYTIQITGKNNATGIALAEIYDATPEASFTAATPRLVNVSARTQVGTGDNVLIAGFAIAGPGPVRVLVRAVGPTLAQFGVNGALVDPKLEIYRDGAKTVENDNWGGTAELKAAFNSVAAFGFAADNSRDAALVVTLAPGTYTAQVTGVGETAGVALVELYELP